ncbi:MAG: O-antigen ligase family protein [Bacteroidetes bacterium]|nr:O-antigen ligase family protein [Bacteroidota bacterium]
MISKDKNIFLCSFLIAGTILEMGFGSYFPIRLTYMFYVFFVLNINKVDNIGIITKNIFFATSALYFSMALVFDYVNAEGLPILQDFFNILWWSIFMVIIDSIIQTHNEFKVLMRNTFVLTFLFTFIVSVLGGFKLVNILDESYFASYYAADGVLISGSSLTPDYNVFATSIILGVIAGKYVLEITKPKILKIVILVSQFYMLFIVFNSYSRRGILFIILALFVMFTVSFTKRISLKSNLIKTCVTFSIFIISSAYIGKYINIYSSESLLLRIESLSSKNLGDDRIVRWDLGKEMFLNYNLLELIFGGGFKYNAKYSYVFFNALGTDHPHNFLVSTALYGGMIALILMGLVIILLCYKYIVNFHQLKCMSVWFFVLLIFSLTSLNTWFSIKLNVILSLLPYMSVFKQTNDIGSLENSKTQ